MTVLTFRDISKFSGVNTANVARISLDLIEYLMNSLLSASHLVNYVSDDIRFDL